MICHRWPPIGMRCLQWILEELIQHFSELEAQKPRVIENDREHVPTLYCCLTVRRKLVTSPWCAIASSVQSGSNNIVATCFQPHMCPHITLKLLHVGLPWIILQYSIIVCLPGGRFAQNSKWKLNNSLSKSALDTQSLLYLNATEKKCTPLSINTPKW